MKRKIFVNGDMTGKGIPKLAVLQYKKINLKVIFTAIPRMRRRALRHRRWKRLRRIRIGS